MKSPWHIGEKNIQTLLGVRERMETFGQKVIRDFMPDQHRQFYTQLPFILLGAVDSDNNPWATIIEGAPGFMHSPDAKHLTINCLPLNGDPLLANLQINSAVGMLGIELHTRRRNRLNGNISAINAQQFTVEVGHSFGNCPQYIQTRDFCFSETPKATFDGNIELLSQLDQAAIALINHSDTFFIASYADTEHGQQVDVSHRGGKPGFVHIQHNVLTIPDFAGNLHFNTLGNLLINPKAGLVFIDFANGDVLQLTGSTEVIFEGDEIDSFQGAERLWRLHVNKIVRRKKLLALRFKLNEFSPNSLMTGSWEEAFARQKALALQNTWRPFQVAKIVDESSTIRSFYLSPNDGAGLSPYKAGQHLPIRLQLTPDANPIIRTYTLSSAPSDHFYRISVKRDGRISTFLHEHLKVGDSLEARAPQGSFMIDAQERRPVVLLSAGVGITPMVAMLRQVVYEGLRIRRMRPIFFIHAARNMAERAFTQELLELSQKANGSLEIVYVLSEPEKHAQAGRDFNASGRINIDLLKSVLPFDDFDFYICGPSAFTQGLYDALRELRIADDRIFAEEFGPSSLVRSNDRQQAPAELTPISEVGVPVVFAQSAKEARWEPESGSLLDLAEARGLTSEYSCRGGSCGTCRTNILEGSVTYDHKPGFEVNKNEALICCAKPAQHCEKLILDI